MTQRRSYSSGTRWEALAGYARAVRVGPHISVAGTTATDEAGALVGADDAYAQTVYIIQKIEKALHALDASLADVVRTRIYMADIDQWEGAARAHAEYFGDIRPANTLLEISRLVGDGYLVEMEADAIVEAAL